MKISARKCSAIVLLLVLATPGLSFAQGASDPKAWAERFLKVLVEGGPERAHRMLKQKSYFGRKNPAAIQSLKAPMRNAAAISGAALGFEFVSERKVGNSLILLTYLVKYKKNAVIWELDFYKPKSGWNLHKIRFYDNLTKLQRQ